MKIRFVLLLLLLTQFIASGTVMAQTSQALYYMNLQQRNTLNPALRTPGRVYAGLPGISDISLRVDNNFLSFSDLFMNGVISDSTFAFLEPGEDLDNFLAGLGNNNSLEPQASVQLFGLGFTVGDDLKITLDVTERADANFVIPGDAIRIGVSGNNYSIGQEIDFSSLRADLTWYHEIGLGASKNITEKLRVGARMLILSGVASFYLTNNGITLTVNDDLTHTVDADLSLNVSAPVTFLRDEYEGVIDHIRLDEGRFEGRDDWVAYVSAMSNPGLGFEAGAEYRFNDMFSVSAAINDLGFIKWKRDRSEIYTTTSIEFNGLTIQDVHDESVTFDELLNWAADSIQNSIDLDESPGTYTTYLPFCLTSGFSFTPVNYFTAGVLSQTRFVGQQVHEALTLSGNFNFGSVFSTTLAYTLANRRYDNLGFGLAVRGGFFQFYALVDNMPLKWSRVTDGEKSYALPVNMNLVHARLGVNFIFGYREKEEILPAM
jgi:hypothetical protein